MSTDLFTSPAASGGGIQWADSLGRLLLFRVHSLEASIPTSLGDKEAVRADITVLDGPDAGSTHDDALVFPRVLIGQLRPRIGQMVLGRLGQGNAKPGQNAPWTLIDPTPLDKETATKYLRDKEIPF